MIKQHSRKTSGCGSMLFWLLAIEVLWVSGPFVLTTLHAGWLQRRGLPIPEKFVYVPWMLGAGVVFLLAGLVFGLVVKMRNRG